MPETFNSSLAIKAERLETRINDLESRNEQQHEFLHDLITEAHDRVFKSNGHISLTAEMKEIKEKLEDLISDLEKKPKCSKPEEDDDIVDDITDIITKKKPSIKMIVSGIGMLLIALYEVISRLYIYISKLFEHTPTN
jgi:uncharacterized coiled-coil protein SlyX